MNHFKESFLRKRFTLRRIILTKTSGFRGGWLMHEEASPNDDLFRRDDRARSPRVIVIEDSRE